MDESLSPAAGPRPQTPGGALNGPRGRVAERRPASGASPAGGKPRKVGRADRSLSPAPRFRSRGDAGITPDRRRGRAAATNPSGRYEREQRIAVDDGWGTLEALAPLRTEVTIERPKTIITRNNSPDISFDRSINPYRGCEHGCIYCFARPTHAFMGLSPGLDFESRLFAKPDAAALLEAELALPGYAPRTIAIGTNTDPYQPIEKRYRIMRDILEVLDKASHPVGIVTKSALVTRDIDILARLAERRLVKVAVSLTTLDRNLSRAMEPRAASPERRLDTMQRLAAAGIPVTVMTAPIVPALNDAELERLLEAAHAAGARDAGYVLLRLPLEVAPLFRDWLAANFPDRHDRVMATIRGMRGGKDYDAEWGTRMRGAGPYAWMLGRRFETAVRRLGLNEGKRELRIDLFRPPVPVGGQYALI